MQTNVLLDDELLEEALTLTGVQTASELIRMAIMELIHSKKRKNLFDLAGQIEFSDAFDYKNARILRDNLD